MSSNNKSDDRMDLICLVEGELTDNTFLIKVYSHTTVDDLRGIIKLRLSPQFDGIAPKDLKIWRVSIPITKDDETLIRLDNVTDKDNKKLLPSTLLSKELPKELPKKTIHILVQPPRPVPTTKSFIVTIKGRTPISLSWSTKPTTATLDDLLKCIYNKEPSLVGGLRSVTVDKSNCPDVIYLESDGHLRTHLIDMVRDGTQHLPIRLEGRPRSFSEITLSDTNRIYGYKSCKVVGRPGDDRRLSSEYLDAANEVVESLMTIIKATCAEESGGTLECYSSDINLIILSNVIRHLFPELKLVRRKILSGRRGAGSVDYVVVSKHDPSRMLAVNTSGHWRGNSLHENMVQLDTISSGHKRKIDEIDNDPTPSVSYGIFSDGISFSFLECHSNSLNESGFNDPEFLLTVSLSQLKFTGDEDEFEASARCIVGHFVWQLQLMVDNLPYDSHRMKSGVNYRKKKGAISGKQ